MSDFAPPAPDDVLVVHGPTEPALPLVLDSPHSGRRMPPDFRPVVPVDALRTMEDCHVDALWRPAAAFGVPLLAAQFPRTYVDTNRHEADIDPALLDAPWPDALQPSGKAHLGKAVVWRLLDDGRPLYDRPLRVDELRWRLAHYHRPYHAALRRLLDGTHARFGQVIHLNTHSMNPVAGAMGVGGAGSTRGDVVLGDRDGSTCAPALTAFVRERLTAHGYDVRVNDPFKGVELVRAHADPARGRHSLQLEINKRLYMHGLHGEPNEHFPVLQARLMQLLRDIAQAFTERPQGTPTP
ncbi:MAG: N-formylglutamate amidohydrolase [Burkholderiaceae bacterium]|nr:N-formylglutamate amidohydrolase [Burkholderiaceae bacterium]